jgi:hypothetical protein
MVLSFLRAYVEHHDDETLIQNVDKVGYVSDLVNSLRNTVESLENGMFHLLKVCYLLLT